MLSWRSVTTGKLAGLDLWLDDPTAGALHAETGPATLSLRLADLGAEPMVVGAGGLGRRLTVMRMTAEAPPTVFAARSAVALAELGPRPLYWRVTQEDGHQAWTTPVYLLGSA